MLNIPIAELNNKTLKEVFIDANMIVDPYFDNPSSGFWPVGSANNGVISDGTLTLDATVGVENKFQTKQNFGMINNNNYYVNIDIVQYIYAVNTGFKIGASTNVSTIPQGSIGLYSEQGNIPYPNSGDVFADYFQLRVQNTGKLVVAHLFLINKTALGIAAVTKARMDYWFSIFYKYRNKQDILVLEQSKVNKFLDQSIGGGLSLNQLMAKQAVPNANMDSSTGWVPNGVSNLSVSNGLMQYNNSSPSQYVYSSPIDVKLSDKYYLISRFKAPVGTFIRLAFTDTNISTTVINEYVTLSGITTATSTSASNISIRNSSDTTALYTYIDYIYSFNITDLRVIRQYSPMFRTTFDLMTDSQIKSQMDYWVYLYQTLSSYNEVTTFSQELANKADKVQENWITPTILNAGVNDANNPVQYMKDQMGFVHFRGKFTRGTVGQAAFTLPAGYRMNTSSSQLMPCLNGSSTFGVVTFATGGTQVYFDYPTVANSVYHIDGITFKAEA